MPRWTSQFSGQIQLWWPPVSSLSFIDYRPSFVHFGHSPSPSITVATASDTHLKDWLGSVRLLRTKALGLDRLDMRWLIGALMVYGAIFASAQAIPAGETASYEGQMVNSVDLVADPHIDIESLRPLVQQPAKQPYSDAKVGATVAALRK